MNDDRSGTDALRDAVETVAADLERSGQPARSASPTNRTRWWVPAVAAAAVVLAATGLWLRSPDAVPEVEILELRIHGVEVQPVIVDDRAPETVVVMPASVWTTERRLSPVIDLVEVLGEKR